MIHEKTRKVPSGFDSKPAAWRVTGGEVIDTPDGGGSRAGVEPRFELAQRVDRAGRHDLHRAVRQVPNRARDPQMVGRAARPPAKPHALDASMNAETGSLPGLVGRHDESMLRKRFRGEPRHAAGGSMLIQDGT